MLSSLWKAVKMVPLSLFPCTLLMSQKNRLKPEQDKFRKQYTNSSLGAYRLLRLVHELRFPGMGPSRLLLATFL